MPRPSLMEGIPLPAAGPAPGSRSNRNLILGIIAIALIIAGAGAYYLQTNKGPAQQPAAVRTADSVLRQDLESKNPPPALPDEPVEAGSGRKVQR